MNSKSIFTKLIACYLLIPFIGLQQIMAQSKDSVRFQDIVITGTTKELRKDEFAIPVEIYSQEIFQKNNITTLHDAMRMISGIQANIDGAIDGAGDIEINGQEGIYTLITIDGVPVSGGNASLYGMTGIPMALIDRIEVIKGPASTLYGSDAIAGVVNVITKNPERVAKFFADARVTSYLETNLEAGAKLKQGKANGLLTFSMYNQNRKWDKDGDRITDIPLQNRFSIFNKWSFRNRFQKISSVSARYILDDRMGGETDYSKKFIGSDFIYGESIRTHRLEVNGNFLMPIEKQNVSLQLGFTEHHQHATYGTQPFNNEERNARIQVLYDDKVDNKSDLLVGASYQYKWYDDNLATTQDTFGGKTLNHPLGNHIPAVFIQDMIRFNKNNEILAGVRFEYNSLYKKGTISPRFDYKWISDKRKDIIRFGVGSGFRNPNIFLDDRNTFTSGKKIIISGDVKTELAYGAHLSYEKKINTSTGYYSIESKAFFTTIINKVEIDNEAVEGAVVYNNDGSIGLNYGLNVNTDLTFSKSFRAMIGFTVMKNVSMLKDSTGETEFEDAINAPLFNSTFLLSYSAEKLGLSIDLSGYVNSPMFLNTQENDFRPHQSPWFSIVNIQVNKSFKCGVSIYARVNNLLNFKPKNVILRPNDPFNNLADDPERNPNSYRFDASYIYAPNQGVKGVLGIRYTLK